MLAKCKNHPYLFLIIAFGFLYLLMNQALPITDPSESNYAQTAKEMVLAGDWLSPQIYGNYWYDKPIFFYWELIISFTLFGFNSFACRFPAAFFGVVNLCFMYWFANRVFGKKVAWTSSLILGTAMAFFLLSKAIITDASFFLFMNGAVAFFYLGYTEKKSWYWLCYAFCGLAVLTKGPAGVAFPGFTCFLFLLWRRDLKELLHCHLFTGILVFLLVAGPWYFFMYKAHGNDFVLNFLGVHNYLRATESEHPRNNTWWFYIMIYFATFLPWSLSTLPKLWRKWKRKDFSFKNAEPAVQLLVLWVIVVNGVFEIVATKYPTYTFPAMFAYSILMARIYLEEGKSVEKLAFGAFCVYTFLALTLAPIFTTGRSEKPVGEMLAAMNTDGKYIVWDKGYRTTAVFYSGKTIYNLGENDAAIKAQKPGELSWKAKNVYPYISKKKLLAENADYILCISGDNDYLDAETTVLEMKGDKVVREITDHRRTGFAKSVFNFIAEVTNKKQPADAPYRGLMFETK